MKLMKYSHKFDERIRNQFRQRTVKDLSLYYRVSIGNLEIGIFVRFINLLRNSFPPKLFVELVVRRLKTLGGELKNELIEEQIMDINFDRVPVAYRFKVSFCKALYHKKISSGICYLNKSLQKDPLHFTMNYSANVPT